MTNRPRIIIMASKTSAYLEVLAKAFSHAELFFIGNRKDSKALNFARQLNINTTYFPLSHFTQNGLSREDYDRELGKLVKTKNSHLVVLAGWLHILSQSFLSQLPAKTVINLHAALLPDVVTDDEVVLPDGSISPIFRGLSSITDALEANITYIGSTVHWVTSEVDKGEVIMKEAIKIDSRDSLETIKKKLFDLECNLLINSINKTLGKKGF